MTSELIGAKHPKYLHCIEMMTINPKVNLPYYGEWQLGINFYERKNDPKTKTAGVWVSSAGFNHAYNPEFVDSLSQEAVNFLILHETFHLLFNHPRRSRMAGYDHELSNIAMDMIINQILIQDIKPDFIELPRDEYGRNTALVIPKEYEGEWIYEILYDWLKGKREQHNKNKKQRDEQKLFGDLYTLPERPSDIEVNKSGYTNQYAPFLTILEPDSKEDCEKYMQNWVRKATLHILNGKKIEVTGHASSVIPDNETLDYPQRESELKAQMFKNAALECLEEFLDIYLLASVVLEHETANKSEADKFKFICSYECVDNPVMIKQREKEIREADKQAAANNSNPLGLQTSPTIEQLFKEYRFAELTKNDERILKSLINVNNLTMPNLATEKTNFMTNAEALIVCFGKGDTDKIIENDIDDQVSILGKNYAKNAAYKTLAFLKDPIKKQKLNRRIVYDFKDDDSNDQNIGGKSGFGNGYGDNGKNGVEGRDLSSIFDDAEKNGGQFFDSHYEDSVPEELREQMVKDTHEKFKARGLSSGAVEETLNRLRKRRKDWLKEIKRAISAIKGALKDRTISKPHRRGIVGIKGVKKVGYVLNCILDTSGSMGGYHEKALGFIFRNDIQVNLIQIDTEVKAVEKIKSMKDLNKVIIKGLGGTTISPAFEYVAKNYNKFNTLLLTDGYTDALQLGSVKGKVLIISNGSECPIGSYPMSGWVKQIVVKEFDE